MVSVKIECGCGQRYAFDVEPVEGRLGSAVACPSCGTDGTAAANAIIARKLESGAAPAPAPAVSGRAPLKLSAVEAPPVGVPAGVRVDARTLGLVGRATAETEARAKISWGDSPDDVIKYLMLQGFSAPEAAELVKVLFQERLAALRAKGMRKIGAGVALMCVPVAALIGSIHIGFISLKLMAVAVMVGLWGCWQVLTGFLMLVAPKMESGDVTD